MTLGFIALADEILWTRFYSYASGFLAEAFGALLGLGLLVAASLAWFSRLRRVADLLAWGVALSLIVASPWLHRRLFYGPASAFHAPFEVVVETRHGVITVDTNDCRNRSRLPPSHRPLPAGRRPSDQSQG